MAARSRRSKDDKIEEVMAGLEKLVEAGRVAEVEEVLTTLIETEPEGEPTEEDEETRTYARGLRDGMTLARGLPEKAQR